MWIEILEYEKNLVKTGSRPARALWIEIMEDTALAVGLMGRGPRGPCGLKLDAETAYVGYKTSRPAGALWIEIAKKRTSSLTTWVEAREGLVD